MKGYSAVRSSHRVRKKLKPGEVRFVTARKPVICGHIHKTKLAARECAKKQRGLIGGRWVAHSVEG